MGRRVGQWLGFENRMAVAAQAGCRCAAAMWARGTCRLHVPLASSSAGAWRWSAACPAHLNAQSPRGNTQLRQPHQAWAQPGGRCMGTAAEGLQLRRQRRRPHPGLAHASPSGRIVMCSRPGRDLQHGNCIRWGGVCGRLAKLLFCGCSGLRVSLASST